MQLFSHFIPRMTPVDLPAQILHYHPGVYLCAGKIRVTEKRLYKTDVHPAAHQVRGNGVAERVRAQPLFIVLYPAVVVVSSVYSRSRDCTSDFLLHR